LNVSILGAQSADTSELCRQLSLQFQYADAVAVAVLAHDELAFLSSRVGEITLLVGLNLPYEAETLRVDALIRSALTRHNINFHVVYGTGTKRLQSALRCLSVNFEDEQLDKRPVRLQQWACERCSDPVCEHRLFQDLLNQA
jgi:hypothetical protein